MVFAEGSEEILNRIAEALENPVWLTFLGRKSCVPTKPLLPQISYEYQSVNDAAEKTAPDDTVVYYETEMYNSDASYDRIDEAAGPCRLFSARRVALKKAGKEKC